MEITLEEAYTGKAATLKLPTSATCEACAGTGAKKGSKPKTCATCAGHGRVRAQQGFFAIERTCPTCQGRGEIIDNPCPSCAGSGRKTVERTLSVNVPPGVEDGTRIRLAGEGEAGVRGGPPGDLYIFLSVKPHPFFQRDGADLYCRVPISMVRAALGGEITRPRASTAREMQAESAGGHAIRPPDQGEGQGHAGAARARPGRSACADQRRDAAKSHQAPTRTAPEFEQESSHHTHPEATGFFARMKELFGK